jgi:signal transduction histidine kinase
MVVALGGYQSPYYAGVNLVLLGMGLLFPWHPKKMGLVSAWLCALYFVPVLIQADFRIENMPIFVNNAAFILSTAIISTAAASLSYRMRKDVFLQIIETEKAGVRVEKSIQAKNEISQELELRDEFISIASHELKTPITVLKLQNDMFLRKLKNSSDPDFQKYFSRTNSQFHGLLRLIDDMLDLSRLTSGKMEYHLELLDLHLVLESLMERFRDRFKENQMELKLDLQNEVMGRWDRLRLEQVMTNLITNAIRYAPGAPLLIKLRVEGRDAVIEVEDYGPGIPLELQEKVFERFSRAPSNYKIAGLGLGLYITRQILAGMKGSIELNTGAPVGASFRIKLPLDAPAESQ